MSDSQQPMLMERLLANADSLSLDGILMFEALDEIERLQARLREANTQFDVVEQLQAELKWYGHTLAGGVPMVGSRGPADKAVKRWYEVTLPLLNREAAERTKKH